MKKNLILVLLPFLLLAQSQQELMKMYQQFTGKSIDPDMINNYVQARPSNQPNLNTTSSNAKQTNQRDTLRVFQNMFSADSIKYTYFEKYVKNQVIDPYKADVKQFAIDFSSISSTINFNKKIPNNYYLNVGDVIVVDIWGAISKSYNLEYNNEGFVIIPDIGRVDLAGLSYGQVKSAIARRLDLINAIKYAIRLKDVKPINVFVVGNVKNPGAYSVSPFVSIMEVLSLAGGIEPSGSYRNIKTVTADKKTRIIDLYKPLFEGQREDIVFENDMLIFVPLTDKQIAVTGNVKKEGIYEYKTGEKLADILKFSGTAPFADLNRIEIERIGKDKRGQIISTAASANPALNDGDIVRIFSTMVYQQNFVYLKGNFRQNKKIEYKDGMKLSSIFSNTDLLKDDTNLKFGQIIRQDKTGDRLFNISFNLSGVLNNETDANLEVFSRDTIQLFSLKETTSDELIKIMGGVKKPGYYPLSKDMTVRDLIYAAGGYDYMARKDTLEIVFPMLNNSKTTNLKLVPDSETENIKLLPNTFVFVRSITSSTRSNLIKINGRIKFPGEYMINQGENISEIIRRAGGVIDNAHLNGIRIFRKSVKAQQEEKLQKLKNELKNKLAALALSQKAVNSGLDLNFYDSIKVAGRVIIDPKNDDFKNFSLQDGDSVYIPSVTNTIIVMGEVIQETAISYNSKETKPSYYLKKSGGITDFADDDNIHIIKANGEVLRDEGWFANINNYQVEPGDMVFVPYDYTKMDSWSVTKDIVNMLYQLSIAAATSYNATK